MPDSQENLSADDVLSVSFVEMTKNEMIDSLTRFMEDSRVFNLLGLTEGKTPLNLDTFDAELDRLRTDLVTLLKEEDLKRKEKAANNKPLADAVYNILLNLAKQKPINTEDYQTLEEIPEDTRVFVSTGHHFDIMKLIAFHATRDYRGRILGETPTSKYLLNVGTNAPFSQRDTLHIQHVAGEKGIIILDLKSNEPAQQAPAFFINQPLRTMGITANHAGDGQIAAPRNLVPVLFAAIRSLDEPIQSLLLNHIHELVTLMQSPTISLEQLVALYARDPAFLNETLQRSMQLVRFVNIAGITLEAFFNFEHDLRFRFYVHGASVSTLISESQVPIDQLASLSAVPSNDFFSFMTQLTSPRCLQALREGSTTLECLVSMSPAQLQQANQSGEYPSPAPRLAR